MSMHHIEEAVLSFLKARQTKSFPESKIWQQVGGEIGDVQLAVEALVAQRKVERIPPLHLRLVSGGADES